MSSSVVSVLLVIALLCILYKGVMALSKPPKSNRGAGASPPPDPDEEKRRQAAIDTLHKRIHSVKGKLNRQVEDEVADDPARAAKTLRHLMQQQDRK